MKRYIPGQNMGTRTKYRGHASELHGKINRLLGQNVWFGFGFSDKIYDIKVAARAAAWGIRKSTAVNADGEVQGGLLIVIPDALEYCNSRAKLLHKYKFIPLSEPLADETALNEIAERAYERKKALQKELTSLGYPPMTYQIKMLSSIAKEAKRNDLQGGTLGLGELEETLFLAKNSQSYSYRSIYRGNDHEFMMDNEKEFENDVVLVSAYIQSNKLFGKINELQQRQPSAKGQKQAADYLHWKVEYVIKQAALTLYMAYGHEPNFNIKIGPAMEKRFDNISYKLLSNSYEGNPIPKHPLIEGKRHLLGSVYVTPRMPEDVQDKPPLTPKYGAAEKE